MHDFVPEIGRKVWIIESGTAMPGSVAKDLDKDMFLITIDGNGIARHIECIFPSERLAQINVILRAMSDISHATRRLQELAMAAAETRRP